jgi:hypothetical protein
LVAIAVLVGVFMLRSMGDDHAAGGVGGVLPVEDTELGGTTTVGGQSTIAPRAAATTAAPSAAGRVTAGGTVVVANASRVDGAAGALTVLLTDAGYTMGDPTNDNAAVDREDSIVYFQPGNDTEAVARSVASDLGGVDVAVMPAEIPTESGQLSASILVLLGNDVAGASELPGFS